MSFSDAKELKFQPFLSLLKKEILRFWKVFGQTVVTPLINSSLYLLIFGVSLGASITLDSGISYLAFLIPGLITMTTLNNSFQNTSSSIIGSKFHGDINDLRVVPLTLDQIILAFSVGAVIRGLTVGFVTFLVSEAFHFVVMGNFLNIAHPLLLFLFLFLGGLAFGFTGIIVGFWAKNFEHVNAIGSFVLLPLIYLGGVFYSISNLHPFWQLVSKFNPLLYFVSGVRYGILGQADVSFFKCFVISSFSAFLLFLLARYFVKMGSYQKW